jgi:hypothetical protein
MVVACINHSPKFLVSRETYYARAVVEGNRHRLCVNRRVAKGRSYKRLRKSNIEFLWTQLEDVIEHGKNKDAKTKLELLQRIYQLLAKTRRKNKQQKKRGG